MQGLGFKDGEDGGTRGVVRGVWVHDALLCPTSR